MSVSTIAKHVKCGERTVKRATAFFESIGWIVKKKCPYQSNLTFMNKEIISLNLNDPTLFFREPCPLDVPVLLSLSSDVNKYIGTSENKVSTYMNKLEKAPVPLCIKIQCLNGQQQEFLSQNFPEQALLEAVNDAKWYRRQGKIVKSYFGLIYSRAKSYFKKNE